jgi:hypothetical protein
MLVVPVEFGNCRLLKVLIIRHGNRGNEESERAIKKEDDEKNREIETEKMKFWHRKNKMKSRYGG